MMSPDEIKNAFYNTTFTLKGRIFHPNLLKTRQKIGNRGTREVYDVQFAWDKNDPANAHAIAAINAFLSQMTPLVHPGIDPRALTIPIKDFDTYTRKDYKPNPEYLRNCKWINAESGAEFPPQVVNAQRQPVMNEAEVYSGANAVVNFQFYPQIPKADAQPGAARGFGVNLNAVMLIGGGEREGGRGSVDVNKIFGAFATDAGLNVQQPQGGYPQQGQQQFPPQQQMGNGQQQMGNGQFAQGAGQFQGTPAHGATQAASAYPSNPQQGQPSQPAWPPAGNNNGNFGGFV